VKHLFVNNVSLSDNLLSPRPRFLKRAPDTYEPLRCKTHDPEQVEALHRVSECVGGCRLYNNKLNGTIFNYAVLCYICILKYTKLYFAIVCYLICYVKYVLLQ
jgi:hypothetical protein